MKDRHLNLFYSYNRDSELIENNLTRAWIVTLGLLSKPLRHQFLRILFDEIASDFPLLQTLRRIDFGDASLALQDHMEKKFSRQAKIRTVLAIASYRYENPLDEKDSYSETYTGSKPDAWIYDPSQSYCILIEAKVGNNPLNDCQLSSHAESWLTIQPGDLSDYLISLDWRDVLEVVCRLQIQDPDTETISKIELKLLTEFEQYLELFGYHRYQGLCFDNLAPPPGFYFIGKFIGSVPGRFLDLFSLPPHPGF